MITPENDSIALLLKLIKRDSVTPDDKGCQSLLAERLKPLGFSAEQMNSGEVSNLWARRGAQAPLFVFAGHTDVVPAGDTNAWSSPPFSANLIDGHVIGRGAADMKGGVAAMITAIERFVRSYPEHTGSIAVLLTSDEEGPAVEGTAHVIKTLQKRKETIDYCLVGEPTSSERLGDVIRNGRRGSLGATLSIAGKQGHVAYPHLASNPIHNAMPMLSELCSIHWDNGDEHFPPTTLQISNIRAGTGASNVIPGTLEVEFNLRYSPALSVDLIQSTVTDLCASHALNAQLDWKDSARPFLTKPGTLTDALKQAIELHTGISATMDTGGGTSDGRFIAPTGAQVIEFGPINATIHQVDERVCCDDINRLSLIYESLLKQLLTG
ncbi:MAG: succinyl-diaminopimelate desuccinylase [Granulosicoccus sp.]